MVDFGKKLRKLRNAENMTQKQLADKLGLTKSVISAYETELRMPSYDVLVQIAYIFKVTTDFLLGYQIKGDDTVDLSGLSTEEKSALKSLITALKKK